MLACSFKAARDAYLHSKWPRAVCVKRSGAVLEPANGAFDVTVAPGEDVQAAVDACPAGGCVLLLPGTHEGSLVLAADKEVHVFGRRRATLRATLGNTITSEASGSTCAGLLVQRVTRFADDNETVLGAEGNGVHIRGGALRLQDCEILCEALVGVLVSGEGTDPTVAGCRWARGPFLGGHFGAHPAAHR